MQGLCTIELFNSKKCLIGVCLYIDTYNNLRNLSQFIIVIAQRVRDNPVRDRIPAWSVFHLCFHYVN